KLELRNRIVMAPMTRSRAIGNIPTDTMAQYYEQRATAGLIITEGIAPSPNGLGYARIPGLFSPEQIEGFRAITARVHARGGAIFAQLMHVGRIAHPLNMPEGARVVAPSALQAAGSMYTDAQGLQPYAAPEALSHAGIEQTKQEFVRAAENAVAAGFDGIELHGANGYLLEQFMHPHTNRRTDAYGGGDAQRNRFVLETAQAVAAAIGPERVAVRVSPYSTFNDMAAREDAVAAYADLARGLRGLAYIHVVGSAHPRFAETLAAIRSEFAGPIMLNGGFDRERAEQALEGKQAELVSFGRPFIANPDFVDRVAQKAALAEPDANTFYTPGVEGYVDYPALSAA
ncbi:MAG TPA: alkene reductase, partial [Polyangiales bacterium]|nr:alkene reductase [Polyangiales bacterium]